MGIWTKMNASITPTINDKSITLAKLADDVTSAISSGGAITESNFPFFQNYSKNLFNKATMTAGQYIKSDGTFNNYGGNLGLSDYIAVTTSDVLSFSSTPYASGKYDSNKNFLGNITFDTTGNPVKYVVETGVSFVRIAMADNRNAMIFKNMPSGATMPYTYHDGSIYKLKPEYGGNKLAGKVWVTEGDSITWGLYSEDPNQPSYINGDTRMPYSRLVASRLGLVHNNYATSGATLGQLSGRTDAAVLRYPNYRSDADIITVASGTNDGGLPLGTLGSTDQTTFYGALEVLCTGLINKYPGKKIGFITPPQRRDADISTRVTAIKEVCAKHSIPVLDLYNAGGLDPHIDYINNWYYANSGGVLGNTGDGLHPSYLGHQVIADRVEAFLKTL
jgi:lysophospholipase L1-like esterase